MSSEYFLLFDKEYEIVGISEGIKQLIPFYPISFSETGTWQPISIILKQRMQEIVRLKSEGRHIDKLSLKICNEVIVFHSVVTELDTASAPRYLMRLFDYKGEQSQLVQLQKISHEHEIFGYRASHDLRSPILSILGCVQLISRLKDYDNIEESLRRIESSAKSLDDRLKKIRDTIFQRRVAEPPQKFNPREIIENVLQEFTYLEHFYDTRLTIEIIGNTPIKTCMSRFQLIISNLLSNALLFRDVTKPHHQVSVSVWVDISIYKITVYDNGIGIGLHQQSRVFEVFYRASEMSKGAGLGLYITKQAIDGLGGTISLQSKEGRGTFVRLKAPNLL